MRATLKALALSALLIGPTGAHADLIKVGEIITDTDTNLEWFTLTATVGISYSQMQANLSDPNSIFYGFTQATGMDVRNLWYHGGFTGSPNGTQYYPTNVAAAFSLTELFGVTLFQGGSYFSAGWYNDETENSLAGFARMSVSPGYSAYGLIAPDWYSATASSYTPGCCTYDVGNWVYRPVASVPEPGTLALFGLGLAGLGFARRRKLN